MNKLMMKLSLTVLLLSGCSESATVESSNVLEEPMIEWIKLDSAEKNSLLSEAMKKRGYTQKEYRDYIKPAIREMDASVEDPAIRQLEIGEVIETMSTNMEGYMEAELAN